MRHILLLSTLLVPVTLLALVLAGVAAAQDETTMAASEDTIAETTSEEITIEETTTARDTGTPRGRRIQPLPSAGGINVLLTVTLAGLACAVGGGILLWQTLRR